MEEIQDDNLKKIKRIIKINKTYINYLTNDYSGYIGNICKIEKVGLFTKLLTDFNGFGKKIIFFKKIKK